MNHQNSYLVQTLDHENLQLQQPLLHLPTCLGCRDRLVQRDNLALATLHMRNVQDVGELQLGNTLKAFLEMGLNAGRVFGLGEDLQELVVGEEEETREVETFLLQVVIQTLNGESG